MQSLQVGQWMNRDLVTVEPHDSFRTAMNLIRQKGIRHLPVVEGKRLVGIVTDRDLRQAAPSGATSHEQRTLIDQSQRKVCLSRAGRAAQQDPVTPERH